MRENLTRTLIWARAVMYAPPSVAAHAADNAFWLEEGSHGVPPIEALLTEERSTTDEAARVS